MNANLVERHFDRIGARAKVRVDDDSPSRVSIDVGRDGGGEFFDLAVGRSVQSGLRVVDTRPRLRHLLLMSEQRDGNRRRNEAFVRQGEWFFVPVTFGVSERLVLRNEPIARGGGKPHVCEELVRQGGELVYVSRRYPNGLTAGQYRKTLARRPELRGIGWIPQRRNPSVFVRGRVRHADHATIVLDGWHQVLMNTETQSVAMRHVAFVD